MMRSSKAYAFALLSMAPLMLSAGPALAQDTIWIAICRGDGAIEYRALDGNSPKHQEDSRCGVYGCHTATTRKKSIC